MKQTEKDLNHLDIKCFCKQFINDFSIRLKNWSNLINIKIKRNKRAVLFVNDLMDG